MLLTFQGKFASLTDEILVSNQVICVIEAYMMSYIQVSLRPHNTVLFRCHVYQHLTMDQALVTFWS